MEATDPASGQVFLEHVTTGESRWKVHDDQTAAGGKGQLGEEAALGTAGSAAQDGGAGVNETGGAATSGQKVDSRN